MKFHPVAIPFFLTAIAASVQAYADDVVELPETVITASKVPTPKTGLAALTTVITAEEIKKSPAQNLSDLLATQANVNVRHVDSSSNGSFDIRGFGMTGLSNTLVLINGVSQNDNDQSAPRISQIPLENIERVEIVRGSGAVQYGGGATGGVINIITKSPLKSQPMLRLTASGGSHHMQELTADFNVQSDMLGWSVIANQYDNNNYRKNNAEHRKSVQSTLSLKGEKDKLSLTVEDSSINLRLPGSLTYAEWQNDPRQTSNPSDWGNSDVESQGVHYEHEGQAYQVFIDAIHREKDYRTYSSGLSTYAFTADEITPRLKLSPILYGNVKNDLIIGVDIKSNSYESVSAWGRSYDTHSIQRQLGGYIDNTMHFEGGTTVNMGLRRHKAVSTRNAVEAKNYLTAWQLGLDKLVAQGLGLYAKVGKSFRLPNADDQGYTNNNEILRPQTSKDYEIGSHWQSEKSSANISLYRNDVTDEIHYNPNLISPGNGRNVNLAPTRHEGVELTYTFKPVDSLTLKANATFQRARFTEAGAGSANIVGKNIPLVPKRMFNLGLDWNVDEHTTLSTNARYVSEQYMDGDESNTDAHRMPSYTLVDIAVGQKWKDWGWKFSVDNLFNKKYMTYAGTTYIYSGAGRSAVLSVNYQFK